jgi:hypothetical protein
MEFKFTKASPVTNEEAHIALEFGKVYDVLYRENAELKLKVDFLERQRTASDSILHLVNKQLSEAKAELELWKHKKNT